MDNQDTGTRYKNILGKVEMRNVEKRAACHFAKSMFAMLNMRYQATIYRTSRVERATN